MKIEKIGELSVVMSNPYGKMNYFAWPTVAQLQNGKIAVVASGFRLAHLCPFGKTVISYSEDEGKTYTAPAPVFDTPLDDRDGGICTFGESGVIVTSFNNRVAFQRKYHKDEALIQSYLDTVTPEEEEIYYGSGFRVSFDCGVTFGEIRHSPVTSPHGPLTLSEGTILWVGRAFDTTPDNVRAYTVDPYTGKTEYRGCIENVEADGETLLSCEPHVVELPDGTLICHIRVQKPHAVFTIFQSESPDGGRTWSQPHRLLGWQGGSPPHLLRLSDGTLLCTYARRVEPYGILAMFSTDEGKTWNIDHVLANLTSSDIGYPASIELPDGRILTVFYAHGTTQDDSRIHMEDEGASVIYQQIWRLKK